MSVFTATKSAEAAGVRVARGGLRVALVSPYSWSRPGGVRTHVSGLAEALAAGGHEVEIIGPGAGDLPGGVHGVGRPVPIPDNGSIAWVALGPLAARRTARLVRAGGYDLVHLHEPMVPAVCLSALLAARVPMVATFHKSAPGSRWYVPFGPLARASLERVAARIAVSRAARDHVAGACPAEYRIIPNGIDLATAAVPPGERNGTRLLFVGRPERRKGLAVLLAALARLPPRVTLDLVGVGDGRARALCRRLPELAGRVRAHGVVPEAERLRLLASADLLCAPSLQGESFGLVLVEAMAAGVPVVASDIPGYADVLRTTCGLLVPPGDERALAAAIAALLGDEGRRRRLGSAGREMARRYDWAVIGDEVAAVYREALAGTSAGRAPGPRPRHLPVPR